MKLSRYLVLVEGDTEPKAVYSGLTGKLIALDPGEAAALNAFVEHGALDGLNEERARAFVDARVLVPTGRDELDVLRARYDSAKYDQGQLGLTIVTSLGCNFDCPYCYESKRPSLLRPDVEDAVVKMVDDGGSRLHTLDITWMGGEPLLGSDALFSLSESFMDRAQRYEFDFGATIVTNGWLLDGDMACRLSEHHCTAAQVTIDGPPDVHDRMRPYVGGGSTFDRIVENLHGASEHMDVAVRVNIDETNLWRSEELLEILANEGLGGKVFVYPAKMTYLDDNEAAPVTTYTGRCYTSPEFAEVELEFNDLATSYGLSRPSVPQPNAVPCTAVAANGLIIGSEGEVWKCWDHIGNPDEVIGDVRNYREIRHPSLLEWLTFNPADDPQCRECIAMPSCMGGCLHPTLAGYDRDHQCGTFRFNHTERVARAFRAGVGELRDTDDRPMFEASRQAGQTISTPVTLSPRKTPARV